MSSRLLLGLVMASIPCIGRAAEPAAPPKAPRELLEKRVQAARRVFELDLARFRTGTGSLPEMFGWSERLLDAELALTVEPAERANHLRANLDRTRLVERMAVMLAKTGQGRESDVAAATYYRIQAELLLYKEGLVPHPDKEPEKK